MTGYIELGSLAVLGLLNSPYSPPKNHYVIPQLTYELSPYKYVFFGGSTSSRCDPPRLTLWNPITARWDVNTGVRFGSITLKLGHVSEHGIDKPVRATESMDYLEAKLRVDF
jgi:hypothetical protein